MLVYMYYVIKNKYVKSPIFGSFFMALLSRGLEGDV
jgi:hypothetical protein